MNRSKIISGVRSPVGSGLEEVLHGLGYKEYPTFGGWDVYRHKDEFAAIFEDGEKYLVTGHFNYETTRDLDLIEQYGIKKTFVSELIGSNIIPWAGSTGLLGVLMADQYTKFDMVSNTVERVLANNPELTAPELAKSYVFGIMGLLLATTVALQITNTSLNRFYGSKLSESAEKYTYGRDAEAQLRQAGLDGTTNPYR